MATVRMTLDEAASAGDVDPTRVDATTEEDIRRHLAEDGFDPDAPLKGLARVLSPAEIRSRAGMTQPEIAEHLGIPVATWRNWEQGRTTLDPAIQSLLRAVANDPERTFRAIGGRDLPEGCDGQLNRMMAQDDVEFLLALVTTPSNSGGVPINNEGARLRRIQNETRFDAIFKAMRKRRAA